MNGFWKGLGYYSRAARLLAGAQKVVKEYNGIFPTSAKDMIANIPGIGRYSAGAISSIAYNHCEPVVSPIVLSVPQLLITMHSWTEMSIAFSAEYCVCTRTRSRRLLWISYGMVQLQRLENQTDLAISIRLSLNWDQLSANHGILPAPPVR